MKLKTITINDVEYIKKSHYDKLEKKKTKVINEKARLIAPDNFSNTLAVIRWDDKDIIKDIFKDETPKEYYGELKFISPDTGEDKPLRVVLRDSIYSYDYFIQSDRIAEAFGYDKENRTIFMSKEKNKPVLLNYNHISVVIAPRVDDDFAILGEKNE